MSAGWVFDANDHLLTRRVDLVRYLTGTMSLSPGFVTDDADLLVEAVTRAVNEGEWDPGKGHISQSDIGYADNPLDAAAAWWLRELGYQNVPMVDRRGGHGRSAATFQPRVSQAMRSASRILSARANCARDTRTAKEP